MYIAVIIGTQQNLIIIGATVYTLVHITTDLPCTQLTVMKPLTTGLPPFTSTHCFRNN